MNKGINDSKDLPQEYLEKIYDEISQNEIKMRNTPKTVSKYSTMCKQLRVLFSFVFSPAVIEIFKHLV